MLPDGTIEEVKIPVEPLAADVRGKTKKEILKAMKTEMLRLLAPMFQVSYDDLRQRHRERRMRRIMTASIIGGVACLLFGIYSTATALHINNQKKQIEAQSVQILAQSNEIKQQSEEIMKQNEELALRQARSLAELATGSLETGDRVGAVKTAVEALTESEGITLPYTPEAQYVLAESLRAYDTGNIYKAEYQYETAGRIEYLFESPDSDTLAIYDDTKALTLFDLEKGEVIEVFGTDEYNLYGINGCVFLGDDRFAYINTEESICIYDLNEKRVTDQIAMQQATSLSTDEAGKYLAVEQWDDTFVIYDGESFKELGKTPEIATYAFLGDPYISTDGILACVYPRKDEHDNVTNTLYFVDLNTMQVISTYYMNTKEVVDLVIQNGMAYIAAADYGEYYSSCDAYVSAIEVRSGNMIWENSQKGYWPKLVDLPVYEEATDLIFITNGSMFMINMQTGKISFVEPLTSPAVESNVYVNSNNFLLFCQNGEMLVVDKESGGSLDLSYKFECKTKQNEEILHSAYGITALERNNNKITVYTLMAGPDVAEIEEEINYPETVEEILGDAAAEIAHSFGLEKPEFVSSIFYSEDEKYCFVQYWDYKLVIYDVEAGEIRNIIEDAYPTKWCLGTDDEGCTYLLGYYGCYMLNDSMQPVMWLPEANGVDIERKKVYLTWIDKHYEAPLYSVEELLQMAEDYNRKE